MSKLPILFIRSLSIKSGRVDGRRLLVPLFTLVGDCFCRRLEAWFVSSNDESRNGGNDDDDCLVELTFLSNGSLDGTFGGRAVLLVRDCKSELVVMRRDSARAACTRDRTAAPAPGLHESSSLSCSMPAAADFINSFVAIFGTSSCGGGGPFLPTTLDFLTVVGESDCTESLDADTVLIAFFLSWPIFVSSSLPSL